MDLNLGDTQAILRECQRHGVLRNQAAYLLATAYHETAHTMKPVEEAYYLGNRAEAYRKKLRYYPWHGRGYVQLTWQRNYLLASQKTGVDLTANPAAAMWSDVAAKVLVIGSMEGWFTGKGIPEYITREASDFLNARRVINGTDKAEDIAKLARQYDAALIASGYGKTKLPTITPTAPNFFLALIQLFQALTRGKKK
jgi:predicted chitinase